MVIVIILVCVMEGVTTATEAAAIAVTYSLLLTVVVYRTMTREKLLQVARQGVEDHRRDPAADRRVEHAALPDGLPRDPRRPSRPRCWPPRTTPWLMLLYINIIQIFLGIFLDMAAHILITTPLFLPLAIQMGVGPVQFGMMLLLNCALGLVHPPVGTVQFVGCAIGKISIGEATQDRLAVLPGDLHRDQPGDLRAGVLDLAAVADHRASGVLSRCSRVYVLATRKAATSRVLHLDAAPVSHADARCRPCRRRRRGDAAGARAPTAAPLRGPRSRAARGRELRHRSEERRARARSAPPPLPHSMAYIATTAPAAACSRLVRRQPDRGQRDRRGRRRRRGAAGDRRPGRTRTRSRPTPSNRFVFATQPGRRHVSTWRFDAATGTLTPNDPPLLAPPPKAGPRHFVWDQTRASSTC